MIFPESAYAEHAETNDTALLIHALHHRIASRRPHVTGRVREGHFEVINFRVKPQFYFIGHNVSPDLLVNLQLRRLPHSLPCYDEGAGEYSAAAITFDSECAALQINAHDPPIVLLALTVMAKTSCFAVADPITRPPSRWSAALAEHPLRWVPSPASAIPKARAHKSHTVGFCRGPTCC